MSGSTAACQYVAQKKAVYAAIWDGQPAIAKCYSTSKFMRSAKTTESQPALKADHNAVMQRRPAPMREGLYQRHPDGFEFFPSLLTHGPICSSLFLAIPRRVKCSKQSNLMQDRVVMSFILDIYDRSISRDEQYTLVQFPNTPIKLL